MHVYVHTYTHSCTWHTHTCSHTHTRTHTHTHTHRHSTLNSLLFTVVVSTELNGHTSRSSCSLPLLHVFLQSKLNSFMDGEQYRQLDSLRRRFFDDYLAYRNDQVRTCASLCNPVCIQHAGTVVYKQNVHVFSRPVYCWSDVPYV